MLMNECSLECSAARHSSFHLVLSQDRLETSSGVERRRRWACSANGRLDFRRAGEGLSEMTRWRMWSSYFAAFRVSARTAVSRRMVGGAIPARMGSWLTGVGRRHPATVRMALLRTVSSCFVWELLHQTGAQYSAAELTSAWVEIRSVFVAAPQVVPARRRMRATLDVVLAFRQSRCCL